MSDLDPSPDLTPDGGLDAAAAAAAGGPPAADEEPAPLNTTVEVACPSCGSTAPMLIRYRDPQGRVIDAANRRITLAIGGTDVVVRLAKDTPHGTDVDEFHVPVTDFLRVTP